MAEPTKAAVSKIVSAAGGEADAAAVDKVFAELEGKDLDALIKEGAFTWQAFSLSFL